MFELDKRVSIWYPQPSQTRVRDSINTVIKAIYFIHLFISLIYSIMLLILEPKLRYQFTSSLSIIAIYGLLVCWILIFNFIAVVAKRQKLAVWCDRFVVKIIIMLFPIFALLTYLHDYFLFKRSIKAFMYYYSFMSIVLVIFQIYSCTCGHHDQPGYLYQPNQLAAHRDQVFMVRNQYNTNKLKKKATI